jgi:hypothetical protein
LRKIQDQLENVDNEKENARETFRDVQRVVNDSGPHFLPVLARQKWIYAELTIRLNFWRRQTRLVVTAGFNSSPLKRARVTCVHLEAKESDKPSDNMRRR